LIDFSLTLFTHPFESERTHKQVADFVFERLKGYCLDQGYTADEFDAVISVTPAEPLDFMQRLQALKRSGNCLKQKAWQLPISVSATS